MPGTRFRSSMLSFPAFGGVTKNLILINLAVFVLVVLSQWVAPLRFLLGSLAFSPIDVIHGEVWQLVTYAFLHTDIFQILFSMLSLWFIGAYLEQAKGGKWLIELYLFAIVGGALIATALSFTGFLHLSPLQIVSGSYGGIFGLLAAFGVLFGEQEFLMFFLINIKAKYLVLIYMFIALASLATGRSPLMYAAYLGAGLVGFLYARSAPRRGLTGGLSEQYFATRNNYYRWKRRNAAKKFEVYMSKQGRDVKFDSEGKYIDPDDRSKWN